MYAEHKPRQIIFFTVHFRCLNCIVQPPSFLWHCIYKLFQIAWGHSPLIWPLFMSSHTKGNWCSRSLILQFVKIAHAQAIHHQHLKILPKYVSFSAQVIFLSVWAWFCLRKLSAEMAGQAVLETLGTGSSHSLRWTPLSPTVSVPFGLEDVKPNIIKWKHQSWDSWSSQIHPEWNETTQADFKLEERALAHGVCHSHLPQSIGH